MWTINILYKLDIEHVFTQAKTVSDIFRHENILHSNSIWYMLWSSKIPHHPLQSITPPSSKYHTTLFKVVLSILQNVPSMHIRFQFVSAEFMPQITTNFENAEAWANLATVTFFLQNSNYNAIFWNVTLSRYRQTDLSRNNIERTTPPSSNYHTTLFKVPHHPL